MIPFRTSVAALAVAALFGCATDNGPAADPLELRPGGWDDVERTLRAPDFTAYAADVRGRLDTWRVPFDAADERELERVAPREYPVAPACGGEVRGVAILVHGLADTAYSLGDVAHTLSRSCLIARTVLLPGHGTRSADLLTVDHDDWLASVRHQIDIAALEHERVLLAGVSLGAILGLVVALDDATGAEVGALVSLSPAWRLASRRLVALTPWLRHVWRWIDKDARDDWARYEAMPMRGVSETVLTLRAMDDAIEDGARIEIPWFVAQSTDDQIIDPAANARLFERLADSPTSVLVQFSTEAGDAAREAEPWTPPADFRPRFVRVRGDDEAARVTSVTHLGMHVSPDNPHWGPDGDFRACSANTSRDAQDVTACLEGQDLWYGGGLVPAPNGSASARGTFNPRYAVLADELEAFVDAWLATEPDTPPD